MDSVEVERAGLLRDIDKTDAEIRRVKERLADEEFVAKAKPAIVEAARVQLRQLEDRRSRMEENLKHVGEHRLGSLPSPQSGVWSPLVLNEWAVAETNDQELPPIIGVQSAKQLRDPKKSSSHKTLSRTIADIIVSGQSEKHTFRKLRDCIALADDDVPTLRLLAAAFAGLERHTMARWLRLRIQELTGNPLPAEPQRLVLEAAESLPPGAPDLLPDPRDGLTRMQRMVVSAMHALSFRADGAFKKTELLVQELQLQEPTLVAADVDATLTQLTHPWSRRNRLVEVSGAHCRLTALGEELFVDLETNAVDLETGASFGLASLLPVTVPLLLAKGTDGIPPYNLSELIAVAARLRPLGIAPDFPNGGVIERVPNRLDVEGRGSVTVHARLGLETEDASVRARFIASELPWPLQHAQVVPQLEALALDGVLQIRDDSSNDHDRIVIELEHVAFARQAKAQIKASGALLQVHDVRFLVNQEGSAVQLSFYELIDQFRSHRLDVTRRRIGHELSHHQHRINAIEGLFVATDFIDSVMRVLVDANDSQEAFWALRHIASAELQTRQSFAQHRMLEPERMRQKAGLLLDRLRTEVPVLATAPHSYESGFTEHQARAILATRRLKSIPRESLISECVEHARAVVRLEEPLKDIKALREIATADLLEAGRRHVRPRQTSVGHPW